MREYKVEYVETKKRYASITVEAENKISAINKAKEFILDAKFLECDETASQSEWTASASEPNFFSWFTSFWKNDRRY